MTTTDAAVIDADRAERLARLRERRAPVDPTIAQTVEIPVVPPSPAATSTGRRRPRRSPARNAKIITAGASATAMFGLIAGYGIADGLTEEPADATVSTNGGSAAETIPPASPTVTPVAATPAPQVIVVVVDGTTGRTLATTTGTGELATDLAAAGVTQPTDTTSDTASEAASDTASDTADAAPAAAPAPTPVAAPVTVDLAVPAPPPPSTPAAAAPAAAAPAPAPQPQAVSDGS